jgi:hypothetical protein
MAIGFPDEIGAEIDGNGRGASFPASQPFDPETVGLDPQWVHIEDITLSLVVERIEDDADPIIAEYGPIPLPQPGEDPFRFFVESLDAEVDGVPTVEDSDLRVLGGRDSFHRLILGEVLQNSRCPPGIFLEEAVDTDLWSLESGRRDLQVMCPTGENQCVGRNQEARQQEGFEHDLSG